MGYHLFEAETLLGFDRHEDAVGDTRRQGLVDLGCRQFDCRHTECFTDQAAHASWHPDLLAVEIVQAVERCLRLDDCRAMGSQTDQGDASVLIGFGQVLFVHTPVRHRSRLGAGPEIRHFNCLGCDVTRVVAVEDPGCVSHTITDQFKLFER